MGRQLTSLLANLLRRQTILNVVQIAQHADDLDRAAAFYEDLLGQPPIARYDPPGLLFFDLGGVRLMLEGAAPSATIYLRVDDVRETVDRLRASDVVIDSDPHLIFHHHDDTLGPSGTDEWQAFLRDSEGNLVGLVSHLAAAPE